MTKLLKTPLWDEHKKLNAQMVEFGGWDMPVQYSSTIKEHEACRKNVAVFDTSHMGNFIFKGDMEQINKATSINLEILKTGKCKYGFLLNKKGGVIDDLIIYKISDTHLMIIVNAATLKNDFKVLTKRINGVGKLSDISDSLAKIDVQGPNSIKILKNYFKNIKLDEMGFFSFLETTLYGEYCILSRTGYTGELGFELYINKNKAAQLWQNLLKDGATACGLGSRDLLRLEVGYSLYGNDLNENITPIEASLGMFLNLNREFVGKDALLKQKENGAKRKLYPFISDSRRVARKGFLAYQEGNDSDVGFVTSGGYSPILQKSIGLVMVDVSKFDANKNFELKEGRATIKVNVTTLPFIKK